jgi:hypothetical protein
LAVLITTSSTARTRTRRPAGSATAIANAPGSDQPSAEIERRIRVSSRSPAPAPPLAARQIATASEDVPSLTTMARSATTSQRSPGSYQAAFEFVDAVFIVGAVVTGVGIIRPPGGRWVRRVRRVRRVRWVRRARLIR